MAQLYELKLSLQSQAAAKDVMNDIKRDLIDAYKNYASARTARPAYNIMPLLAQKGEPNSKEIIARLKDIVDNLDTLSVSQMFNKVNGILAIISKLSEDENHKEIRNAIFRAWFPTLEQKEVGQADKNQADMALSKFEQTVFKKFARHLEVQAKKLKGLGQIATPIAGGPSEPLPKALSKETYLMFMKTPEAAQYGLDDMDVMTKMLEFPDTRYLVDRLINAIKRGHRPRVGGEVLRATDEQKELKRKMQSNLGLLEASEEEFGRAVKTEVLSPQEEWSKKMQQAKQHKSLEQQEEEAAQKERLEMEPLIQKRDEEAKKREIEKDRERHIRSEGSLFPEGLLKRYQ